MQPKYAWSTSLWRTPSASRSSYPQGPRTTYQTTKITKVMPEVQVLDEWNHSKKRKDDPDHCHAYLRPSRGSKRPFGQPHQPVTVRPLVTREATFRHRRLRLQSSNHLACPPRGRLRTSRIIWTALVPIPSTEKQPWSRPSRPKLWEFAAFPSKIASKGRNHWLMGPSSRSHLWSFIIVLMEMVWIPTRWSKRPDCQVNLDCPASLTHQVYFSSNQSWN